MTHRPIRIGAGLAAVLALWAGAAIAAPAGSAADLVVTEARIFTSNVDQPTAEALAVRDGRIVYVGGTAGALALVGPATRVERMGGRRVLPGLIDAHIHPLGVVQLDVCDLQSQPMSLSALTAFVRACIDRYHVAPGHWLNVEQWNFSNGNQPDAAHPTLRAALDLAAGDRPIQLRGNDGHHGAFNSAALALARNPRGQVIGLSRATLETDFAGYRKLVGVDGRGEPNGGVNEDARSAMVDAEAPVGGIDAIMVAPERVVQALNGAGITAVQDAMVTPDMYQVYDALRSRGALTLRVNMAQFYDPDTHRLADGAVDYDGMVVQALAVRARYAGDPLIRADVVKLFADGVLEGDPFATPPTAPESPSLKPYLQPIFGRDAAGRATLTGYVNPDSDACRRVLAAAPGGQTPEATDAFVRANGFYPAQCSQTNGRLQHDPAVIAAYLKRMHLAGFTLHVHAIGDRAVKTAIDAIEAARAADGDASRPDTIAHAQLVAPEDVARIGRDHLFVAFTYAWAYTDPEYDLSVIPFVDHVANASPAALHDPRNYYERQAYPVRSIKAAGGVLIAGSDAPVDTRDPRPFVNMQMAVTRALPGLPPLNLHEAITLPEVVAAYTIDGARGLGRQADIGSLQVGKSADFIVLDRDILSIPVSQVGQTKVLQTWFMGRRVYAVN